MINGKRFYLDIFYAIDLLIEEKTIELNHCINQDERLLIQSFIDGLLAAQSLMTTKYILSDDEHYG